MGFNEQAKQDLMKEMGIKTKCGLRRAHFGQKSFLEARERERRDRFEERSRFWWEIILIYGFQVIDEEEGS